MFRLLPCIIAFAFAVATSAFAEAAPAAVAPGDSTVAVSDSVAAVPDSAAAAQDSSAAADDDSSSSWKRIFTWPFEHIIQPVLNAVVYPIAQPLHYAFDNGVIETSVDLITFGEKRNILLYPIMNLKPGNSTMLGFAYRHRSLFFGRDYLVVSPQYFANGDFFGELRYTKHELFGTRLFGGIRVRKFWDRDGFFVLPGTPKSFVMPDSSTIIELQTGIPLTNDGRWTLELKGIVDFVDRSLPDNSQDSLLVSRDYPIENRGLYQSFMMFPVGASILYDNLDFPYAPSRGSRMQLMARYIFVGKYSGVSFESGGEPGMRPTKYEFSDNGKNHDFLQTEFMFQHYFYFGKAQAFHLTRKEARQNRRFYMDFNWNDALRMWRPDNVKETLFERRVIALQFRLVDNWEMEEGEAPFKLYTLVGPRFPLRGYRDYFAAQHVMSLSAEYRWPIDYYVDGVLFNEYALLSPTFTDWSPNRFYNSWGFGVRVRKPDMYWFRVQLGFHGLHGVNLVLTIAPEFK